jgi:hypothetical protein
MRKTLATIALLLAASGVVEAQATATRTPSNTPMPTASKTFTPSRTPSNTRTATRTATVTNTATNTRTPTATPPIGPNSGNSITQGNYLRWVDGYLYLRRQDGTYGQMVVLVTATPVPTPP